MDAQQTLFDLRRAGVIAVLRGTNARDTLAVARELLEAGITALEITYTTPDACTVIHELASDQRAIIGAGTITQPQQAADAAKHGARFLISPGIRPDLIHAMHQTGLAVIPGALTPTEIMTGLELGASAIKLFPAATVGPSYLRELCGPFPDARLIPTGGITPDNASEWIAAGAWAVGAGGALAPKHVTDAVALRGRARTMLRKTEAALSASLTRSREAGLRPGP